MSARRRRDEPVRLTRIYTRAGDEGETSLGDLSRVPKLDPRIAAYGLVDELNSWVGLVLAGALRAGAVAVLPRSAPPALLAKVIRQLLAPPKAK